MLKWEEVAKHQTRQSCWVVIQGKIYDLTSFIDEHPGGAQSILRFAGKDGTEEYEGFHPAGTIEKTLSPEHHLGFVDPATIPVVSKTAAVPAAKNDESKVVPISLIMNLNDFEREAQKLVSQRAWAYFHSAADSLQSFHTNISEWKKVSLRPRVLRNVSYVDMQRTIMGQKSSLPFFIAPAALARLAHPDGEKCLAWAAGIKGIPYCTSSYASVSHEDIAAALAEKKGGHLFFQLYVSKSKESAIETITEARRLGYKALMVTVDTPVLGKREEDELQQAKDQIANGFVPPPWTAHEVDDGEKPILRSFHSTTLNWEDLIWIREAWGDAPLVLKGIQTAEDAKQAADSGVVDGIYLSNHGGRQIDDGPSSIRTLLEIRKFCPEVLSKVEVVLDGGVRRGADILKALCLGASAVSLGRPFMYAIGGYGTEGAVKAIQILSDEIETTMRLLGVTSLSQLNPEYVNFATLERDLPRSIRELPLSKL
ncbi:FMN-dependent dehydrogenase-domain-containing protein [Bisporella sp. PMI_857]|nr:FMN-dependent dehydrogenase-domain-containing protein [Bisporella sp. PMI_857]